MVRSTWIGFVHDRTVIVRGGPVETYH
jgi:hypothetical protein